MISVSSLLFFVLLIKSGNQQLNIENKSYYFYNDLINLSNVSINNLKLDKKTWKDIDIYYIGITLTKIHPRIGK